MKGEEIEEPSRNRDREIEILSTKKIDLSEYRDTTTVALVLSEAGYRNIAQTSVCRGAKLGT